MRGVVASDRRGGLGAVADRDNHRIQFLDKDGKYIAEYKEFSRPSGLVIDKNDNIYVTDSESNPRNHAGWLKGIRIGNLKDGKVTTFIPPHDTTWDGKPAPEGGMEGIAKHAKN